MELRSRQNHRVDWRPALAIAAALCWGLAGTGLAGRGPAGLGGVGLCPVALGAETSAAKGPASTGPSSLDQQLLEDLDNELLDGAGKKTPSPKPAKPRDPGQPDSPEPAKAKHNPPAAEPDQKPTRAETPAGGEKSSGGEKPADGQPQDNPAPVGKPAAAPDDESSGEDIGQGPEDPLTRIGREMRRVEQLIAEQEAALREAEADKTGQLQQKIVKELADLIDELEKRQNNMPASMKRKRKMGSQESAQREKINQQQPGASGSRSKPSNQPATDSSNQLRNGQAQRPDAGDMKGLMKDLWGQLPAHARDQMLQTSPEQFLPRYELQLEKYYKRLAEQQKQSP